MTAGDDYHEHPVVIVGPTFPFRGGIVHYVSRLFSTFLLSEIPVKVVSFSRMYPAWLYPGKSDKDPCENLSPFPDVLQWIDSMNPFSWVMTAWKITRMNPSMVLINWWNSFWGPVIWTLLLFLKLFGLKAKVGFICHNVYDHERNFIKDSLTGLVLRWADVFFVHSRQEEAILKYLFPRIPVHFSRMPLFDAFPAVTRPKDELRRFLGIPEKIPCALFFGFVRPYKGLETLLEAIPFVLKKMPEFRLLIAGEFMYDLLPETRKKIAHLGIESSVVLRDAFIPIHHVAAFFEASDVLVLPYHEATGSAVLGMAYSFETPVVATSVGNFPEDILEGQTGLLVPPNDPLKLADALLRFFLEMDHEQCRETILEFKKEFTWESIVQRLKDEYL